MRTRRTAVLPGGGVSGGGSGRGSGGVVSGGVDKRTRRGGRGRPAKAARRAPARKFPARIQTPTTSPRVANVAKVLKQQQQRPKQKKTNAGGGGGGGSGPAWDPFSYRATPLCDVRLELLSGAAAERLGTIKSKVAGMCRGTVGAHYARELLGKPTHKAFGLLATDAEARGRPIGFVRCSVHSSFAGGGPVKSSAPVRGRIVLLDLICTEGGACRGLGQLLMRALVDVSVDVFGASLLVLEAIPAAAGYYSRFGFRRVPDACHWPSPDRVRNARDEFSRRAWNPWNSRRADPAVPSFKETAAIDRGVGPVWWKGYNRASDENATVIMSLCLGPPKATDMVRWGADDATRTVDRHLAPDKLVVPDWKARLEAAKAAKKAALAMMTRTTRSSVKKTARAA